MSVSIDIHGPVGADEITPETEQVTKIVKDALWLAGYVLDVRENRWCMSGGWTQGISLTVPD